MVALVLLPGMDGGGALFAGFVAALGDWITPLVLSYPADEALDYQGLCHFARTRLPRDQPFVLLGESFSGPVAIALAAQPQPPPMLLGLILSCTFARNPVPVFRHLKSLVRFAPLHSRFSALGAPLLLGGHSTAALRRSLSDALGRAPAPVLRTRLRAVLEVDYSDRLRSVAVPVLYLQAAQDWVVPRSAAAHILALLPGTSIITIPGPHLLLQAQPGQAAEAVTSFIRALPAPSC